MSFSSMPNTNTLVSSSYLQNLYNSLNTSNVTNNTNLTPSDAGFVGFTGVRANANSFQVVAPGGQTGFVSLQQAQQLGLQTPSGVVPLVNSQGIDFSGVKRFVTSAFGVNQAGIVPTAGPIASGTPTPGNNSQIPTGTQSTASGRTLGNTLTSGLSQVQSFLGPVGLLALVGLGIFLVVKK